MTTNTPQNTRLHSLQVRPLTSTNATHPEISRLDAAGRRQRRHCRESCPALKNHRMAVTIFESSRDGIAIINSGNRIAEVNAAYQSITGYSCEELKGSRPKILSGNDQLQKVYKNMQHDLLVSGHWQGETWKRHKNGQLIPVWLSATDIIDEQGKVINRIEVFSDISQQQNTKTRLHALAYCDPLTGLPNRASFYQHVERVLSESILLQRKPVILLIDLDEFKQINDTLGHRYGDQLLKQAAQRMKLCLRKNDMLARLGGDEFTVLLDGDDLADGQEIVAEKLLNSLLSSFHLEGKEVYIRASLGIYKADPEQDSAESLIQKADIAMYRAKEEGKGCYRHYDSCLNNSMQRKGLLTSALHQAIELDQFHLCYQIQVDANTAAPVGMEALLRWDHPQLGSVSPFEFIPVAEACGLILPIGEWVLRRACEQIAEWQRQGIAPLPVAVNVSPEQFYDENLVDKIVAILHQSWIPPSLLEIEVTETAAMSNTEKTVKQLDALKQLGIKIAIDDFGTGYSSLSYLKKLPISKLKIDREFIKDILVDADNYAITKAVIDLSHTMDLRVVAEGVETEQIRKRLVEMNCDVIQGFLYSRPVPAAEVVDVIQQLNSDTKTHRGTLVDLESKVKTQKKSLIRPDDFLPAKPPARWGRQHSLKLSGFLHALNDNHE
ncbi:MAG: bifunctional diguanylate cyclase/phosphodiesterase [Motiliproteus sp.]